MLEITPEHIKRKTVPKQVPLPKHKENWPPEIYENYFSRPDVVDAVVAEFWDNQPKNDETLKPIVG